MCDNDVGNEKHEAYTKDKLAYEYRQTDREKYVGLRQKHIIVKRLTNKSHLTSHKNEKIRGLITFWCFRQTANKWKQ